MKNWQKIECEMTSTTMSQTVESREKLSRCLSIQPKSYLEERVSLKGRNGFNTGV